MYYPVVLQHAVEGGSSYPPPLNQQSLISSYKRSVCNRKNPNERSYSFGVSSSFRYRVDFFFFFTRPVSKFSVSGVR
jgi:hypothetical protein